MHRALFLFAITLSNFVAKAQDCDCKANFLWVKETFEQNDAGFEHIVKQKGQAVYAAHNKSFEERVADINDYDACQEALEEWIRFFRTDHFRFTKTDSILKKQVQAEIWHPQFIAKAIDTVAFKTTLSQKKAQDIEGIWENPAFTIVVKRSENGFVGSVLREDKQWKKGQIVFKVDQQLKMGTRYQSTFKPTTLENIKLVDDNILLVDQLTFKRVSPASVLDRSDKEFYRLKNSKETFAYLRDDSTVYLRIPLFHNNKRAIDSVLTAFDETIKKTANLIIDLRECQGGQDNNFTKLLPYLYTGNARTVFAEVRSTPRNNKIWDELINSEYADEEEKEAYRGMQKKLNEQLGAYVNIFGQDVQIDRKSTVLPFPKNIGIIVHENNFSTTEQFILAAKQSRKVKLFGRKTGGALDVSNMVEATAPSGDFVFEYCISRSLRIPEMAVDDMGIHPDFYLDKGISENHWVDHVSEVMDEWR